MAFTGLVMTGRGHGWLRAARLRGGGGGVMMQVGRRWLSALAGHCGGPGMLSGRRI